MVRHLATLTAVLVLVSGSAAGTLIDDAINDLQPFAYYPLDDGWDDASGNGRHGAASFAPAGVVIDSSAAGTRSEGRGSTASLNSGAGGGLRATADNPFSASGDMTLAMWLKWDGATSLTLDGPSGRVGDVSIFGKRNTWGPGKGVSNITGGGYTNDGRVADGMHVWRPFNNLGAGCTSGDDPCSFKENRFDHDDGSGGVLPPSQEWVHWAFVYENYTNLDDPKTKEIEADGTVTMYINGQALADTVPHFWDGSDLDNAGITVGHGFDGGGPDIFPGHIDDFWVFNRALSSGEIARVMVPEPATLGLLGLGGLMLIRRKRAG
jgi:hypothetical protein